MKTKHWLMLASLALITTAAAQTKPYSFILAGKPVQLPTLEQKNQVFVDITQLGKAMGFGVKIDRQKRTVELSNTFTAVARLTPPINPNAPIQVNTTTDTLDAKPGDAICADSGGKCSLRAAIQEVLAQRLTRDIQIPKGTYLLEKGALTLPQDPRPNPPRFEVRLKGEDTDGVIINADARDRAFLVDASQKLRLETLTIRGGKTSESGGAILQTGSARESSLVLNQVKLYGNRASQNGGAIFIQNQNSNGSESKINLEITNSDLSGNLANQNGGAVYVESKDANINIQKTLFVENSASQNGGALFLNASSKIIQSQFLKNDAAGGGGGAIYNDTNEVLINITGSSFEANTALKGAGIQVMGAKGSTIDSNLLKGNEAKDAGGGIYVRLLSQILVRQTLLTENNAPNGQGGGVYLDCSSTGDFNASPTFNGVTLVKNRAKNGAALAGCGNAILYNSTVSSNIASEKGGATYQDKGSSMSLELTNSTIFENQAVDPLSNQLWGRNVALTLRGSILSNTGGKNCTLVGNAFRISSTGYNIVSDDSCGLYVISGDWHTNPTMC